MCGFLTVITINYSLNKNHGQPFPHHTEQKNKNKKKTDSLEIDIILQFSIANIEFLYTAAYCKEN